MVYAHCNYSLEIGKGTEVSYNLPALERQLIEIFVRGKPYVDIKVVVLHKLFYFYYFAGSHDLAIDQSKCRGTSL